MKEIRNYIITESKKYFQEEPHEKRGAFYGSRGYDHDNPEVDPAFQIFDKRFHKVALGLTRMRAIADGINGIVQIGSVIRRMMGETGSWVTGIKEWIRRKKTDKDLNNITSAIAMLGNAIKKQEWETRDKIEKELRDNAVLQGVRPLRRIMVFELCLLFNELEIPNEIIPTLQNIVPKFYHHADTQYAIEHRHDSRHLEANKQEEYDNFMRNRDKYRL